MNHDNHDSYEFENQHKHDVAEILQHDKNSYVHTLIARIRQAGYPVHIGTPYCIMNNVCSECESEGCRLLGLCLRVIPVIMLIELRPPEEIVADKRFKLMMEELLNGNI